MKKPKTIKGLFSILKKLETWTYEDLKGYDNITDNEKESLVLLFADLSNVINEREDGNF